MKNYPTTLARPIVSKVLKTALRSAAVAAACAAAYAPASAQSSVQLYGNIDVAITRATGVKGGSVTKMASGTDFPSQIGIKGREDLGGGLSSFFDIATGFCSAGASSASNPYCTGGSFMGRTSMLGLQGDFGRIAAGRFLLPVYLNAGAVDPFHNGTTGGITNLNRAASAFNFLRASQLVEYTTPNLHGVTANAVYGFGAQPGSTSANQLYNLSVRYASGPLMVGAAYLRHNQLVSATQASAALPVGSVEAVKVVQAFGSYDFGDFKLGGMFQTFRSNLPAALFEPVSTSTAGLDTRFWMLGVSVPVGPGTIAASYSDAKDTNVANSDAHMYAVGYIYRLSKQTSIYTDVSRISNGAQSFYGVHDASNTDTGLLGTNADGFSVGMRHVF